VQFGAGDSIAAAATNEQRGLENVDALISRPTTLTARGSHELKGKSAAIQVFALAGFI
jgi:hypothetical protein